MAIYWQSCKNSKNRFKKISDCGRRIRIRFKVKVADFVELRFEEIRIKAWSKEDKTLVI